MGAEQDGPKLSHAAAPAAGRQRSSVLCPRSTAPAVGTQSGLRHRAPRAPPGTPSRHVTAPLSTRPCGQRRASRAGSPCSSEVTAEIRPSEGGSASSSGSWRLIADRARVENQKAHFTKHFDTPRPSVEPPRRGTERLGEAPEGLVPQLLCSPPVKPKRFLGLFGKILTFQAKRRPLGHKLRSVT